MAERKSRRALLTMPAAVAAHASVPTTPDSPWCNQLTATPLTPHR